MRVLLDESLPRRLKEELPGHDVRTVAEIRWAGKKNGDLLRLVLLAKSNDYADVQPVLARLGPLIETLAPGQVLRLTA